MDEIESNFNSNAYFKLYPELKKRYTNNNVWLHYKKYGKSENRIFPNNSLITLFDGNAYCNMYPDVKQHFKCHHAWMHYLIHGIKESRRCYIKGETPNAYMDSIINTVIKKEENICFPNESENKITILIRTCYRPLLFKRCINSILMQEYSNMDILICYDNKDAINYINPYLNDKVNAFYIYEQNINKYKFNLYCNTLINKVTSGYCIYLDDDNEFTHKNCLNIINHYIANNKICVWKYLRGDNIIYPPNLNNIKMGEIDASSFCLYHTYKTYGKWPDQKCGDYFFFNSVLKTVISKNNSTSENEITFIPYILTKCIQNKIGNFGDPIIMQV